jgi:hypothetical protein
MAPPFSSSDYTTRITTTSSGGALTENSVTTSNIINRTITGVDIALGTIKGENIEVGTIEAGYLDPVFLTYLTNLENKVLLLEQTAVIRSFDTLVAPTSSFSIPVNLAESESIQIDINILVGGTGGQSVHLKANTSAATNVAWENYNGHVTYGETVGFQTLEGGGGNNGIIAVSALAGQTIIVSLELFRSFDINTPSQKYYMKTRSLSFFLGSTYGLTKIDSQGAVGNAILTGVTLSVPAGSTIKASYSMIQDKRRAFYNSILS